MTRKRAKDLCCGDIFKFRGTIYLCMSCVTMPAEVVIVTCLPDRHDLSAVVALQLLYDYVVHVSDRSKMVLHPVDIAAEDLLPAEAAEMRESDEKMAAEDAALAD